MLHAFKNCSTCSCFISFYAFQRVFLLLSYYYVVILSLVLARETKIIFIYIYNLYLLLLLSVILNVITMYIHFILDVELSNGACHLHSTS